MGTVTNPAITPAQVGSWVIVKPKKWGIVNVKKPVTKTSLAQNIAKIVHKVPISSTLFVNCIAYKLKVKKYWIISHKMPISDSYHRHLLAYFGYIKCYD